MNYDNYMCCILTSGNKYEFPELEEELQKRKIDFEIVELSNEGRIFLIPKTQLDRLPRDEKGPYLGDDNSGHSIYELSEEEIDRLKNILGRADGTLWK